MKANITFQKDLFADSESVTIYAKNRLAIMQILTSLVGEGFVMSNVFITDDSKKEENKD